jgi:hypothetical protein
MGLPDVFLLHPSRHVTDPSGTRWHVNLVRGSAWSPRVDKPVVPAAAARLGDDSYVLLRPASVRPAPKARPTAFPWLAYRARRRTGRRVAVRPATATFLREAVVDRSHPDKRSAGVGAPRLTGDIASGRRTPPAPAGPSTGSPQ